MLAWLMGHMACLLALELQQLKSRIIEPFVSYREGHRLVFVSLMLLFKQDEGLLGGFCDNQGPNFMYLF